MGLVREWSFSLSLLAAEHFTGWYFKQGIDVKSEFNFPFFRCIAFWLVEVIGYVKTVSIYPIPIPSFAHASK